MRVLLTSAGLETEEIKECFLKMLERINATGFHTALMDYIRADGMVIGVSAGQGSISVKGSYPIDQLLCPCRTGISGRIRDRWRIRGKSGGIGGCSVCRRQKMWN